MLRWRPHLRHDDWTPEGCPAATVGEREQVRDDVVSDTIPGRMELQGDRDVLLALKADVRRAGRCQERRVLELEVLSPALPVLSPLRGFGNALRPLQPCLVAQDEQGPDGAYRGERDPARPGPARPRGPVARR